MLRIAPFFFASVFTRRARHSFLKKLETKDAQNLVFLQYVYSLHKDYDFS